ncbi:carboxymuconolactone decarboxylase family protein [Streptomyces sp. NPDC054854]
MQGSDGAAVVAELPVVVVLQDQAAARSRPVHRASQVNHCAFCLDMHTKDALAAGESVERVVLLAAWEESRHFYTEKELAAIELTEAVTVLTDGFVPDEVYARAAAQFEEAELAQLIAVIATINVWNRIGVTTRSTPGHYTPGQYKQG